MRAGIIFNPTARGNKARRFLLTLRELSPACELFPTLSPGSATELAAAVCRQGFTTVIAAGGDGTVSEVADGLASVAGALDAVRLGVIPLGTINVFARELGIPRSLKAAWQTIEAGREIRVDLPVAEVGTGGARRQRHFVQMAGCGLDSRAIAEVNWDWKKRVGPLAYAAAAAKAMRGPQPQVRVTADGQSCDGELVLIGNGRLYGGEVTMFPLANLHDGALDARVFPRVTCFTLFRFGLAWLLRRPLNASVATSLRGARIEVRSNAPMPVEVDGDNIGSLPASFTVRREALRVIVP